MRSERLSHRAIRWPWWPGFPIVNTFAPAWLESGAQTRWRWCLNPKRRWRCPIVVCQVPTRPPAASWAAPAGFPAPPSISTIPWFRSERARESYDLRFASSEPKARAGLARCRRRGLLQPDNANRCGQDPGLSERLGLPPAWAGIRYKEMKFPPSEECRILQGPVATALWLANRFHPWCKDSYLERPPC